MPATLLRRAKRRAMVTPVLRSVRPTKEDSGQRRHFGRRRSLITARRNCTSLRQHTPLLPWPPATAPVPIYFPPLSTLPSPPPSILSEIRMSLLCLIACAQLLRWVFWFRQQRAPGNKNVNYEEGVKKISSFSSVRDPWSPKIFTHFLIRLNPSGPSGLI